jgi:transposase
MELELEELEAAAGEDAAQVSVTGQDNVSGFTRRRPVHCPLPDHLPRERVVVPSPTACPCCGSKLAKLGESITETL